MTSLHTTLDDALHRLCGVPVMVNDTMVSRAVRQVRRKRWHRRRAYADRVDKKWLKRYGTELAPLIRDGEVLRMAAPVPPKLEFRAFDGTYPPALKVGEPHIVLVMNSTTLVQIATKLGRRGRG